MHGKFKEKNFKGWNNAINERKSLRNETKEVARDSNKWFFSHRKDFILSS